MNKLSTGYELAKEFALSTGQNFFLTGKAGTGKTTFLRNLQKETRKQMAIVAPTGVAAINAGGTTMHSFFQLPFTPFIPTVEGRKDLIEKQKMQRFRRKVLQELELLVIDEISMVRADVLDAIDAILRHVRYRFNDPFGGVQVIFIGDMFQLSPVALEEEWRILSQYYQSPYFFHSQVILKNPPVYIEFDKIFRQSNQEFISLLNEVRNDRLTDEGLLKLQSRYDPTFIPPTDDTFITLTTHNYKADKINAEELLKLKGKTYRFEAKITGDFPEKSFPTDKVLELKTGAKVMFIKNDTESERRFYNGKIGIIRQIENDVIFIDCQNESEPIELSRVQWENIRYKTNDETKTIEEETLGTFVQFPIRLAWAITIHKSQGLTFEKAVIDAGDAFAPGQVYVALSRCRSLEGIVLRSRINPYSIENDRQIVEYEKNKMPTEMLEEILQNSMKDFRKELLLQFYDFRQGIGQISRLQKDVLEVAGSFNEDTLPYLKDIQSQIQQLQEIAEKFQKQVTSILENTNLNEEYLNERIIAANTFFNEKIDLIIEMLQQSPATTDSRENARDYNDQLRTLFGFFAQKQHILKNIKVPFIADNYFSLKNNFFMPDFKPNAYAKTGISSKLSTRHPKLYYQLLTLRNEICDPENIPIYLVAGSKTLIEMADFLPQTESELLQISGFGPAKVQKYGHRFLEIICKYIAENNLNSFMSGKVISERKQRKTKTENTEKKEKKEKGDSHRQTLEMYRNGKTIEQIASERNLTTGTICSHLAVYTVSGVLNIDDFISQEKRQAALELYNNTPEVGSVIDLLSPLLTRKEISFFLTWMRNNKNKQIE